MLLERLEDLLAQLVGAIRGDAPLDEQHDAVARGKPDLVAAAGGEAIGGQRVVDGQVEVLQRVQKGSVKVKDNGLVHE